MSLAIKVVTLFPEMIREVLSTSILGRAERQGQVTYEVLDIRDRAVDRHGTVDDAPYGGGAGMVLMAPPVVETVEAARRDAATPLLLMSAQGERLDEDLVLELAALAAAAGELVLVCGHYKGVDQRVLDLLRPREVSIGDYVLTGGELPALVVIDALVRRLPGVLGNSDSAENDSFTAALDGGLEGPWYTRPPEYRGLAVPEILISGHHANIERWRAERSRERTRERRPDLAAGKRRPPRDRGDGAGE